MPPLFAPTPQGRIGEAEHPWYRNCRDHRTKRGPRVALTRIWNQLGHLLPEAPVQFVDQFRRDFPARSWELYMLSWLSRSGATIERAPSCGPDLCATHPQVGRFWIECIVPTRGQGDDAAPERPRGSGVHNLGADTPVALRYTSAITEKIRKVNQYRDKGIVGPCEPVVVALNQGAIDLSELHDAELPLAMRVLYGIGDAQIRIQPYARTSEVVVPPMLELQKRSGARISSVLFAAPGNCGIAGVLLARLGIFNLFNRHRTLLMAHNPETFAPVPIGALPVRGEVWVAPDRRLVHRGVVGDHGPFSRYSRRRPD